MQDIIALIGHPEKLNHDTLQRLREVVAAYPYFQVARLLLLQNLYVLHDATFGEELRTSALFLPDRRVLFSLIEGMHYKIQPPTIQKVEKELAPEGTKERMASLIDNFFLSLGENNPQMLPPAQGDVANDYSAFLLQLEDLEPKENTPEDEGEQNHTLITGYIEKPIERVEFAKKEEVEEESISREEIPRDVLAEEGGEREVLTETLAKIYIKQGKYEKAIEIIQGLHLIYPKKNRYFADQIRFLQKLIINNNSKKEHV